MSQDQALQQVSVSDSLDPSRLAALAATLDLPDARPRPFWHHLYFWTAQPPHALGSDGHPKTGGLIPDMGLPRRMWAGGRLQFHASPVLDAPITRTTTLLKADRKQGRTGPLGLVTLRHDISQNDTLLVTEEQDLIYRAADAPTGTPPRAPTDEAITKNHVFTTTELFRYSALTFNGHRIHYDRDYAMQTEGYAGLVVHGPLLAQHAMLLAEDHLGSLSSFTFRATAPLMDFETATFCAKPSEGGLTLWVRAQDGRQCLTAQATA